MKKFLVILVILGVAAFGGWRYMQGSEAKKDKALDMKKPPVAVVVAAAMRADVPLTLSAVGNVVTNQSVAVRSRIDSQLMDVKFKDGDEVHAGDLLFVLDDRALKARVTELQANLTRDRAQMENLQRQYGRKKGLADKGYETASNLDDAHAQLQVQNATVAATQASIENLKVELQYTNIMAPISGRTGTINTTVGNTVKANDATPLVTINQVKPVRVQVSIPQKYLEALRAAQAAGPVTVQAASEGGKAPSQGVLDYIDNTIDNTTGTFLARASFANEDERLWPGMFVTANVDLNDEKNALTIPEVAIQHGQDGDFVFVIAEDKAVKRLVKIGRMQDNAAVIAEGLKDGEKVAVDGMMKLEEGSVVTVAAPGNAAAPPAPDAKAQP